jgi:hypothetical protein
MPQVEGHPLWVPEPNSLPIGTQREQGVTPGDVGFITSQGSFTYMFHIFSGPGAPRHGNPNIYETPHGFIPIEVNSNIPIMDDIPGYYNNNTFISSATNQKVDISVNLDTR